jgi:outer membrane protein insertion porin family
VSARLACGVLLVLPLGIAQVSRFEGRPITDVQFSPAQTLDQADLDRAQPLKKDERLRAEDVTHAIDGLFATGRFDDIAVEAEPSGNGVLIRFVVKNAAFVGGVAITGKTKLPPNRGQITTAAQLNLGAHFRDEDVKYSVQSITNLLKSDGFYEAQVDPKIERDDKAQQVFVTFAVKEGKRAKFGEPTIAGETKLSDATIFRVTGWRIAIVHWWRQVTNSRVHDGIQRLLAKYAKQDRLRAQVELKELDYDAQQNRVRPSLNIDPGPKVKVTSIEDKVSRRVLKRYVPVFTEGTVDNDLLAEGQRNLRDYLQSQGYYDADVQFRILPAQDDLERIEYAISRGPRHRLTSLNLSGNKYFDNDTLRERMFIEPASFRVRRGRYSEAFLRKDEENIKNLYLSNGFRDVKISSATVQGQAGDVSLTIRITEAPQWLIDRLEITGVNQVGLDQLTPLLAVSAGQPFSDAAMTADRDTILTYYYDHGFPAATFNASSQPSGAPQHVNVTYTIVEGERQYVREVLTSGFRVTRPSHVEKRITLKPGDPLSPTQQTGIQKQFYDMGIFARVDTAIENPDGDTRDKYVLYNFDEANRYTIAVGLGAQVARFGTPNTNSLGSPAGSTGFSPEFSLNVSRLNFLGLGHTVSARGVYSNIEKRGSLSYLQPRFREMDGRNITYSLLYDNTLDVRTFAARREEGSVQVSQSFSKSLTGVFRFAYRRVSVSSIVIPTLLIPQLVQPVRVGMLSATLVQDRRDNPADPHRGIYTTADFGIATSYFGSQRDFGRVLVRNATYYRITRDLVLARQTQFGVIAPFSPPAGISAQESIPLPERFFSGGADSLRGFAYNEAGPRDTGAPLSPGQPASAPTGFPLGGNALFANNIELRFPLIGDNIQGVFFHDMGNVYTTLGNMSLRYHQNNNQDFDYANQAVGFGVRYRTPVGPIRVDVAYSLNPPSFVGFQGTPLQLLQCGPNAPPTGACQSVPQTTGHFQFFFSIGQTF